MADPISIKDSDSRLKFRHSSFSASRFSYYLFQVGLVDHIWILLKALYFFVKNYMFSGDPNHIMI